MYEKVSQAFVVLLPVKSVGVMGDNRTYDNTVCVRVVEAVDGMNSLLDSMTSSEVLFVNSKASIIESITTSRVTKSEVLSSYTSAKRLGLDYDIRKSVFEKVSKMTMKDVKEFQEKYIMNQPKVYLVIGSKEKMDIEKLKKFGTVEVLTLDQIFGY